MLIRTSRSTDNFARTTAAATSATRTSPETHSRVRRAFSSTSPAPIRTSPSSLSRALVNTTNMFRRSASVSQLPAKHDVTFHPSYNTNAPIYVPRSSATHIPTPSHPTPHASSSIKTRGGSSKNQSTRAPLMTRAPRLRRTHAASHIKRTFKLSSRAQQQNNENENENENEMENDIYLQEDHENENVMNENETTLLTSTVTGSWESPVPLTSASMSPPTLSLSHSSSTTSSNPSPPDLILFSDTMSPSESSISMSTASSSSSSSPMLFSSSSTSSPLLSFHTPAVSDFELVTEDGSPSVSAGQCGSYLVRSRQTKALSIFKPQDEEMYEEKRLPLTMRQRVKEWESPRDTIQLGATTESAINVVERTPIKKGVVYGDTVLKEVAAYLLDHQGWAGVPSTISTHLALKRRTSDDDKTADDKPSAALIQFGPTPPADQLVFGSLQEYRQHMCSAEDIGSSLFAADEVHKIGVLDIRLLNLDRHLGNLLVSKDASGYHLIPIDHGYTLPSYQDLSDVTLEWRWWRQSSVAFSDRTLEYIARLDPLEDARILRMLGIRDESLVAMIFATLLLQRAAHAGLTLQTIASMVCRDGLAEQPSTLEMIISQVLALMKSGTDVTLTNVDIPATSTEPSVVDVTTPVSNVALDPVSTPMSSLSVHDIEEDRDTASPSSTSLPITITPPALPKSSAAAVSPAASPTFSSVSSSYSTSPSCSSLSSSHSSLNNFSLKPSPSIQKLFSFATLPTVSERHLSRRSSQLSHAEDEHENDEEDENENEVDVGSYDHDETFRWESESDGHDGQDGHTTRARVSSVSSSGSSEEDGSSHSRRRRRSKVSTSTSVQPTATAPTTDASPKDASSPAGTSSSPSSSSLPVVADDGLSDRLQRLLRTTEVVIDREIARIKQSAVTQPQAQS